MEQERPKNLLVVDPPNELRFSGPFNRPVVTIMKLLNPSNYIMVFKIKTTAPKRYCVRPNFGSVEPQSYKNVEICLQPFVYDANEKCKHKFMVQSLVLPTGDIADIDDLNKVWKEAEPDQLMDAKLKCVFEMPTTSLPTENDALAMNESKIVQENVKMANEEKILNLKSQEATESDKNEVKQLRDENEALRQANINLKEQVMRLRFSPMKVEDTNVSTIAPVNIPMFYIALALVAAIIGLILGKFLL